LQSAADFRDPRRSFSELREFAVELFLMTLQPLQRTLKRREVLLDLLQAALRDFAHNARVRRQKA
jgi:hypothetical protein